MSTFKFESCIVLHVSVFIYLVLARYLMNHRVDIIEILTK